LVAAAYFALLARSLGVSGYGAFAGVCAMAGILAPFASLGTGNLLIQAVARDRAQFPRHWANCLQTTCISGALFTGVSMALARFVLPSAIPVTLVLFIAISELIFVRLLDGAAMAFQALEQLRMTAWFSFLLTFCRMLAAAVLLLMVPHASPLQWSELYLASTTIPACAAIWFVTREVGAPSWGERMGSREYLQGLYFSVSMAAQSIYNDIDKTMLARISGLSSAGLYSAAYRIVDAAFSPVNAVFAAAYPRFFQLGAHGIARSSRFGRRVLGRAALYSSAASIAIWFAAPLVPSVLGANFRDSIPALRMLSPILVFRSLHYSAADALTGAGHQGLRTILQLLVAGLNVGLNLIIIPRFSWLGAVFSSVVCDGALAILLWIGVLALCARERRVPQIVPQDAAVRA
jgi:O-antigen/teichoic acid export membrane protein